MTKIKDLTPKGRKAYFAAATSRSRERKKKAKLGLIPNKPPSLPKPPAGKRLTLSEDQHKQAKRLKNLRKQEQVKAQIPFLIRHLNDHDDESQDQLCLQPRGDDRLATNLGNGSHMKQKLNLSND